MAQVQWYQENKFLDLFLLTFSLEGQDQDATTRVDTACPDRLPQQYALDSAKYRFNHHRLTSIFLIQFDLWAAPGRNRATTARSLASSARQPPPSVNAATTTASQQRQQKTLWVDRFRFRCRPTPTSRPRSSAYVALAKVVLRSSSKRKRAQVAAADLDGADAAAAQAWAQRRLVLPSLAPGRTVPAGRTHTPLRLPRFDDNSSRAVRVCRTCGAVCAVRVVCVRADLSVEAVEEEIAAFKRDTGLNARAEVPLYCVTIRELGRRGCGHLADAIARRHLNTTATTAAAAAAAAADAAAELRQQRIYSALLEGHCLRRRADDAAALYLELVERRNVLPSHRALHMLLDLLARPQPRPQRRTDGYADEDDVSGSKSGGGAGDDVSSAGAGREVKVAELFEEMKARGHVTTAAYNALLPVVGRKGGRRLPSLKNLLDEMVAHDVPRNELTWKALLESARYCTHDQRHDATRHDTHRTHGAT
jgi:pentatricopeptide repeat protein